MVTDRDKIADALEQRFKRRIEVAYAGFQGNVPTPFEKIGVALPKRDVWLDYADAVLAIPRGVKETS